MTKPPRAGAHGFAGRTMGARGIIALGGVGVAAPLCLAALGAAPWGSAVAAAAIVGATGLAVRLGLILSAPSTDEPMAPRRGAELGLSLPVEAAEFDAQPFRAILDHLADPLLLVSGGARDNPDARRYVFVNAAARDLLRLGRPEGPLSTALRAPEVLAAVDEALFDDAVGLADYQPGGPQDRFWRLRAAPLASDGPPLALVILRDDTEVRRGEKARANFLANASHELRTPLASLAGFIDTLRGHARDDPEAREKFLAIMHGQAERMRRLIDDLMSLSRIELAEHIVPSGRVDLAVAVTDVADALQPLAAEREIDLRLDLPPRGEVQLVADRDQVLQVAQNLIENAVKFSPRGGVVVVEVRRENEGWPPVEPVVPLGARFALLTPERGRNPRRASLSVRDRGPGIPPAELPRLTERFYRVAGRRTRDHPGTGLGLAIVKHIVNRHRGGLTVESAEGQGSMFTVYLPMRGPSPALAPRADEAEA
ncbi:MAG: ATP-binding protein [Caulobacteraceae bacterium]